MVIRQCSTKKEISAVVALELTPREKHHFKLLLGKVKT